MNIMSLDCEFNQPSGKLIQIGACVHRTETGVLIDTLEFYVNPNEPITDYITNLTGITDNDVSTGVTALEGYNLLKSFHNKYKCFMNPIVWGSGVSNDSLHIYLEASPDEPNFMGFRVIDAKVLYQSKRIITSKGIKGGLQTACTKEGIGFLGKNHTALADAINTFRIWHHLARSLNDF